MCAVISFDNGTLKFSCFFFVKKKKVNFMSGKEGQERERDGEKTFSLHATKKI
jgi:hypothetical protein